MIAVDALICALICLRVVFYRRTSGSHRPVAAWLAYIIATAAGAQALLALLGKLPEPGLASVVLHGVLLLALVASRGNVVELLHTSNAAHCIVYRFVRRKQNAEPQ